MAEEHVDSSVTRGLDALSALADSTTEGRRHGPAASVSELARRMGRDRSQVSRMVTAMAAEEFVVRDDVSGGVAPHWRLYAAARDLTAHRLRTDGLTALEGMATETGESCYLGVLVGDTTVTIAERVPPGSRQLGSWIGRPYPAYCSDCGQALLSDADDDEVAAVFARTEFVRHGPRTPADLDDFLRRLELTRRRGYSVVDEEAEPGLYSVAVPVRDFTDEVVAAVQVVGPRRRLEPRTQECVAAALRWGRHLETALRGA
ncbi:MULTISPECIES: IclR family transcriptional regulator [Streptomyces]|uniref:DNA-binding IclR family transcriptional regulator n=1 Tax=Streptomyces stelliscabiei TaxID=146820 RepID=A0A8I0TME6_9ACTN|nr:MULTISPECIES: IclR family transcriptional regulator [Streptomyces]KND41842.1 IclR family transcriptional regulator [Streptomyces stelliscabiei]MBE1594515.1 DNA-binding IclR family transcriptional regulator [Streptomyces stelliscabiei]MDX2556539.1 IclR family transcriptional regulator [Streptomyces stelliscabiei]MDX2615219.1 IclR family transcriptional regulator [Streptomyces stelliscabiei]MDX2666916.1 IclR family transcriptional regulator [Streptomyces stelliscabiei]